MAGIASTFMHLIKQKHPNPTRLLPPTSVSPPVRRSAPGLVYLRRPLLLALLLLCLPSNARASFLSGEALDTAADVLAWVVLVVAPAVGIAVFWLLHILPEKIAEKKRHPQAKAIQTLCLLSLFFGGLLWPIAWLWAYTKPVLHKLAYGTDVDESHGHADNKIEPTANDHELARLRLQVAELESKLAVQPTKGAKV